MPSGSQFVSTRPMIGMRRRWASCTAMTSVLRSIDEHRVGRALHVLDAAQVRAQLGQVGLGRQALTGGQQRELALGLVALEVVQAPDALADRLEVRQQPAEPAVVDVRHAGGLGDVLDGVAGLLLRADEEHGAAAVRDLRGEVLRVAQQLLRLEQVDEVDAAALAEDVAAHLGVPASRLVAEVDAGLQQLLDPGLGHGGAPLVVRMRGTASGRGLSADPGRGGAAGQGRRGEPSGVGETNDLPFYAPRARSSAPGEVGRQRRADVDGRAGGRVGEGQPRRVQELSLEAEEPRRAVLRVAGDRVSDGEQVGADLVGAPRLQPDPQQRRGRQRLLEREVRHRPARLVGVGAHPRAVAAVAPDGRVDRPACAPAGGPRRARGTRASIARRASASLQRPVGGLVRARHDEQARGVPVEAVHDPRAARPRRRRRDRPAPGERAPRGARAAGCTTRPAGLSTTSRCSSS